MLRAGPYAEPVFNGENAQRKPLQQHQLVVVSGTHWVHAVKHHPDEVDGYQADKEDIENTAWEVTVMRYLQDFIESLSHSRFTWKWAKVTPSYLSLNREFPPGYS